MIRLAKIVETNIDGMQIGCSIAVVNDIDVAKSKNGNYYYFTNKEIFNKYRCLFKKNWEFGQVEIHFMSNDDYEKEKMELDKQALEIQTRIEKLELCHRIIMKICDDEAESNIFEEGFFVFEELLKFFKNRKQNVRIKIE